MTYSYPATLTDLLDEQVKDHPHKLALTFKERRWSYAEFAREVDRVANGFLNMGVEKGDRVALVLPNCGEFLFAVFAATKIGAVFVPLNPQYTAEEAEYVLQHSEASFCMTSPDLLPLIHSVRANCPDLKQVVITGSGMARNAVSWDSFVSRGASIIPSVSVDPEDLASITYTSGTTDRPKGVMLSQYTYAFAPRTRAEG
ncbi:MAG TPA: AMP-binding protein, partial [Candidatus Binatia bacterium]|nr:AMP-binding protein [Candidatus Binatia bacterium]